MNEKAFPSLLKKLIIMVLNQHLLVQSPRNRCHSWQNLAVMWLASGEQHALVEIVIPEASIMKLLPDLNRW